MAKTSLIERNDKRKAMAKRHAQRRSRLKAIASDREVPAEDRFAARLKLAQMPRNSAPVRVRNLCEVTGRSKGVYRKFRLSRIMLRELGLKGHIPGLVKSSW